MKKETQEQFDANVWWTSMKPAEHIELRDKYAPGSNLIDMPVETIVLIWKSFQNDLKKSA